MYCYLTICPIIRLSSFCLVTEVISVRLEWNILCARFRQHLMDGLCDSYCHNLTQVDITLLFLLFCWGTVSIGTVWTG